MAEISLENVAKTYVNLDKKINKIAEHVDTIYGQFMAASEAHEKDSSKKGDITCQLCEVLNSDFNYTVEWGQYKSTDKIPNTTRIGDIMELNSMTGLFSSIPGTMELTGFFTNMFGKKPKITYKAMEYIDNSRASISHIYKDYETMEDKNKLKDSLIKELDRNEAKLSVIKNKWETK